MNILLINHYAGSIYHGMEYRPYYLAKKWVEKGHNVTIIAASYSHLRTDQDDICKNNEKIDMQDIDGINYLYLNTPIYSGNGVSRFKNMISFVWQLYKQRKFLVQKFNPDVVIGSSTYPLDMIPAKAIAKLANAKVFFEVHDLWPLSPMELGNMSKYHPFIQIMQFGENFAYKHSYAVISMLPKAEEHMLEHGLKKGKFHYIPNGFNQNDWILNGNSEKFRYDSELSALKSKYKLLIGYAGGHNISNALDDFIQAIKINDNPSIAYCFVGKGTEKKKLYEYSRQHNLNNVYFFDAIPKLEIPIFLEYMDILYIGWKKKSLYRFGVSPNKLFDYMMAKKPILHAIEAGNDLVQEAGCGISVVPENPEAISKGITLISSLSEDERIIMAKKGYDYVLENHEYEVLANKFLKVINKEHSC